MQTSILLIADAVMLGGAALIFGPRLLKNYHRKVETPNAFMIQNVTSGLVIRPRNAEIADGVPIIQYTPQNWECTTWQMIGIDRDTYLLKDLYTQKSFGPVRQPVDGVELVQQPIGGDKLQHWVFEPIEDNRYRIRLADTNLYITSQNSTVNARLILTAGDEQNDAQQWILKQQHPII